MQSKQMEIRGREKNLKLNRFFDPGRAGISLLSFLFVSCLNYNQNASPILGFLSTTANLGNGFSIGGTLSGILGSEVTITRNDKEQLVLSNNANFQFSTLLKSGETYEVKVVTQPTSPSQTCSVTNGSGVVSNENVTSISIFCSQNSFQIGGTISNLTGTLVLQNNGSANTTISSNGAFTMANLVAATSSYSLSILTQPAGQTCFLSSGTGTLSSSNVSSVEVNCVNVVLPGPLVGGQVVVSNLLPSPLAENAGVGPAFANDFAGLRTIHSLLDGVGTGANFYTPLHLSTDGLNLYVADSTNNSIRKIVIATRTVSTLVTIAGLSPRGVTNDGVNLYFTGLDNTIRKYNFATSTLSLLANTGFDGPRDIATDGSNLYIADTNNHVIKKINLATNVVTTIAGKVGVSGSIDDPTGIGGIATFNGPRGLTYCGNTLYVANTAGHNIRKIDLSSNPTKVVTIAGSVTQALGTGNDATGINAEFYLPTGITCDSSNLFVVDNGSSQIRKISLTPPYPVTWFLGCYGSTGSSIISGGPSTDLTCDAGEANFHFPFGITTDGVSVFISEQVTHIIRKID